MEIPPISTSSSVSEGRAALQMRVIGSNPILWQLWGNYAYERSFPNDKA